MEIKRCARCGGFFETVNDVCNNCIGKDNKELGKLKNFLSGYDHSEEITRRAISNNTGITMKNLNRFLSGEEFSGVQIPQEAKENSKNITVKA